MLYMREERPKVVAQCKVKESATINQILGQRVSLLQKLFYCNFNQKYLEHIKSEFYNNNKRNVIQMNMVPDQ